METTQQQRLNMQPSQLHMPHCGPNPFGKGKARLADHFVSSSDPAQLIQHHLTTPSIIQTITQHHWLTDAPYRELHPLVTNAGTPPEAS